MSDLSDNEYFPPDEDEDESYDPEADIYDTYAQTLTAYTPEVTPTHLFESDDP